MTDPLIDRLYPHMTQRGRKDIRRGRDWRRVVVAEYQRAMRRYQHFGQSLRSGGYMFFQGLHAYLMFVEQSDDERELRRYLRTIPAAPEIKGGSQHFRRIMRRLYELDRKPRLRAKPTI